jgi:hypothetical protein
MKKYKTRVLPALVVSALLGLTPAAAGAQTEIFRSMTNERCSDASRDAIANAARRNVESHVTRAEASIQPPTPVGDLSCLNDLMNINIDFLSGQFFSLDTLFQDLLSGFQNITLEGIGEEVTRQICRFAQEKWEELTEPLNLSVDDLLGDISPSFTSNFALINISGGGSGGTTNPPLTVTPPPAAAPQSVTPRSAAPAPSGGGDPSVQDAINQIYNSINGGN